MDELPSKNRAEPHRRLLRHTYQEGPGFLFLATRGGRPPGRPARPVSPGSGSGRGVIVPDDLAAALAGDAAAARGFAAMSASVQKPILFWVTSAKRPETRARRIVEIVRYVAVGRSPLEWPRRPLDD
jgi:hypothetical protein